MVKVTHDNDQISIIPLLVVFEKRAIIGPRTIWHQDNLAPWVKVDNLAPRTIWHRGQFGTMDNLAPYCKSGQLGTKNLIFGVNIRNAISCCKIGVLVEI